MTTAPDTAPIPDEDDDETPPTPDELLVELGQLHARAMASPHPANPEAMAWQMIAAAAVAGFTRALHALNEQDPTKAARVAAVYHGPFGEGPDPQAHAAWLERFVAGSPETFQRWVDEGRQAAAEAALHAMNPTGPTEPERPADSYPPALPWAALMDDEDLAEFLADVEHAIAVPGATPAEALGAVEKACGTWRLIAEAQHAHNTAAGPNATDTKEN